MCQDSGRAAQPAALPQGSGESECQVRAAAWVLTKVTDPKPTSRFTPAGIRKVPSGPT